jgi:hypothetical protein
MTMITNPKAILIRVAFYTVFWTVFDHHFRHRPFIPSLFWAFFVSALGVGLVQLVYRSVALLRRSTQ